MIVQPSFQPHGLELMDEIWRYLDAVEAFRAEGHEPSWRPERPTLDDEDVPRRRVALHTPPIP